MQPVSLSDPNYRALDSWYTNLSILQEAFSSVFLSIQNPSDFERFEPCFCIFEERFRNLVESFPAVPVSFESL